MDKTILINEIVEKLKAVSNITAIVLGGTYATGTQRPDSDIDLGLYYSESNPFDIGDIRKIASELNDEPNPVVTNFSEWGKWVNGGAWLTVKGQRVDFLYRNVDFVSQIVYDCNQGKKQSDYYQQPPYGFHSYIYCAEIQVCKPLFDPQNIISNLKLQVKSYSKALKKTVVDGFLWDAEFSLKHAEKSAIRGETYIVAGCLTKIMSDLVQVVYALNETYFIGDKKIYNDILQFKTTPLDFFARISEITGQIGESKEELTSTVDKTKALIHEVIDLTKGQYKPKY